MPGTHARRVAAALAAVTLYGGVAGCTSAAAPAPVPMPTEPMTVRTSPTPTPSPDVPVAPTLPAEAQGTTAASAKAFVRYWVAAVNYAMSSGDVAAVQLSTGKSCESCNAMVNKINEVYADGGYFRGEGWRVISVKYQPFQPARHPVLSVGVQLERQEMAESSAAPPTTFPGGPNQLTLELNRTSSGWKVVRLERLS